MVGEVSRRQPHALLAVGHLGHDVGAVRRLEAGSIVLGNDLLRTGLGHEHPMPRLTVAAGWRLQCQMEALFDDLAFDGAIEIEPLAHGSRRGQQLVGAQIQTHVNSDRGVPTANHNDEPHRDA